MMSSMYIGATGLKSHGEGMGVISNNLSNVNTLGYKQMSMQYADLMSSYMTAAAGNLTNTSQKGMGATAGSVRTLFTQGGLEKGSEATDLCITGTGFFGVTQDGAVHYTRAGNFRFDNRGALLDASGWNVMGRPIVNGAEGSAQGIILDMNATGVGYMPARATTVLSTASRLGGLEDKSADPANPFFAMAAAWNGASATPLDAQQYSYAEPVQFYDTGGELRNATLYYDLAGSNSGNTVVEYLLGMPPGQDASGLADTRAAGLLMAGTLTFASDGALINMTAFSPPASGDNTALEAWTPAAIQDGRPVFVARPEGAQAQSIALDMGFAYGAGGSSGSGSASAAELAAHAENVYSASPGGARTGRASTATGEAPATLYSGQDGFAQGRLRTVSVGEDGIIRGVYDNNQEQDLYRVSLYRFTSQDGLRHEGGNHYTATSESGPAQEGVPGTDSFGTLEHHSLEQSNVDYAREFTLLIMNQRGFQMNSKVITTSDTMLQKALEIKR